jgi:Spy/CpxP family protein refolding chaperone
MKMKLMMMLSIRGLPGLLVLAALALLAAPTAPAQIPPDRDGLLNGEGMGMAACAESNGFPGPKHVLDLADKLGLTAKQKAEVQEIYDDMLARARSTGKMIVKVEGELNDQFNSGMLKQESVEEDAESIGRMRGTLRGIHLGAHVRTKEVLTPKQVELYVALRKEQKEKDAAKAGKK